MNEKREGFLGRLFRGLTEEPPREEAKPAVPEPAGEVDDAHTPAGPPETTVNYVERVERHAEPMPPPRHVDETPMPTDHEELPVARAGGRAVPAEAPTAPAPEPKRNWFQRLAHGLKRSSDQLGESINAVFTKRRLDEETLVELEDILIQADLGLDVAERVTEALRRDKFDKDVSGPDVRAALAAEVAAVLEPVAVPLRIDAARKPFVILMVGVNGTGKTTTTGKLAQKFASEGRRVMLAAGDTFRAAAIEQLQIWGERTNAPVVTRPAGSDASGLAFDAVTEARAKGVDVLIIDTAGRLHNRDELMGELEKMIRVIRKVDPDAPHATLLTLDATTGQNALNQVEIFRQRAGVSGLVMTKLDSTARGGILVAIAQKFGLPVHFVGVGEGVDDLQPFAAADFARAIAGSDAPVATATKGRP